MILLRQAILIVYSSCVQAQPVDDLPSLQGPYLGQEPPGMTPEVRGEGGTVSRSG